MSSSNPLSSWRWKDEDEFQALIEWGLIDPDEALSVRAEALSKASKREPPFSDPWPSWKPDSDWPLPSLGDASGA